MRIEHADHTSTYAHARKEGIAFSSGGNRGGTSLLTVTEAELIVAMLKNEIEKMKVIND
jgi:hypothetical protein